LFLIPAVLTTQARLQHYSTEYLLAHSTA